MEWLKWLLDALLAPIASWRTTRRERRQWTWQRKAEFLAEIETDVGVLEERLKGWGGAGEDWEDLARRRARLQQSLGRLRPFPKLQGALRDFAQLAAIIIDDRGRFESPDKRASAIAELTRQCDAVFRLLEKERR